jgi:hypothetical protein
MSHSATDCDACAMQMWPLWAIPPLIAMPALCRCGRYEPFRHWLRCLRYAEDRQTCVCVTTSVSWWELNPSDAIIWAEYIYILIGWYRPQVLSTYVIVWTGMSVSIDLAVLFIHIFILTDIEWCTWLSSDVHSLCCQPEIHSISPDTWCTLKCTYPLIHMQIAVAYTRVASTLCTIISKYDD